jgi:hypothetical protein
MMNWATVFGTWQQSHRCDRRGLALFNRHYSARKHAEDTRVDFVGPAADCLVLLSTEADALFVWRKTNFRKDMQTGIECAVFRNEGDRRSSDLIRDAVSIAMERWPDEHRFFTFVNPRKIKSANPGYCFKRADWHQCGTSTKGLIILEYTFAESEGA